MALSNQEIVEEVQARYGFSAWAIEHDELGPILIRAARNGWSAARLRDEVTETRWWKKNSASAREFQALREEDPATWRQQVNERRRMIDQIASRGGQPPPHHVMRSLAEQSLKFDWNESQIRHALAAESLRRKDTDAFRTEIEWVKSQAQGYLGRSIADARARRWGRRIFEGRETRRGFEQWLQGIAKKRDPDMAPFIDVLGLTPVQAQQRIQANEDRIFAEAKRLGVPMSRLDAQALGRQKMLKGWSDVRLRQEILSGFSFEDSLETAGAIEGRADDLRSAASDWMVPLSDKAALDWSKRMAMGQADEQAFKAQMMEQAKGRFPGITEIIEQGVRPSTYFEPYRQEAARLLEMSPEDIDLIEDSRFSPIIEHATEDGERRPMTLSEAQQHIRSLDAWKTTRRANQKAAQLGEFLTQTFGETA